MRRKRGFWTRAWTMACPGWSAMPCAMNTVIVAPAESMNSSPRAICCTTTISIPLSLWESHRLPHCTSKMWFTEPMMQSFIHPLKIICQSVFMSNISPCGVPRCTGKIIEHFSKNEICLLKGIFADWDGRWSWSHRTTGRRFVAHALCVHRGTGGTNRSSPSANGCRPGPSSITPHPGNPY